MTAPEGVTVREATADDFAPLLELPWSGGLADKHADRLVRQARGAVAYLLALERGAIVGHLLLKWDAPEDPQVRAVAPPCAEIEDLVVDPARRGLGIGTLLIEEAASAARARGERLLGLGVGKENAAASRLYHRLGFTQVPGSDHRATWPYRDASGTIREGHEDCVYLVRKLS